MDTISNSLCDMSVPFSSQSVNEGNAITEKHYEVSLAATKYCSVPALSGSSTVGVAHPPQKEESTKMFVSKVVSVLKPISSCGPYKSHVNPPAQIAVNEGRSVIVLDIGTLSLLAHGSNFSSLFQPKNKVMERSRVCYLTCIEVQFDNVAQETWNSTRVCASRQMINNSLNYSIKEVIPLPCLSSDEVLRGRIFLKVLCRHIGEKDSNEVGTGLLSILDVWKFKGAAIRVPLYPHSKERKMDISSPVATLEILAKLILPFSETSLIGDVSSSAIVSGKAGKERQQALSNKELEVPFDAGQHSCADGIRSPVIPRTISDEYMPLGSAIFSSIYSNYNRCQTEDENLSGTSFCKAKWVFPAKAQKVPTCGADGSCFSGTQSKVESVTSFLGTPLNTKVVISSFGARAYGHSSPRTEITEIDDSLQSESLPTPIIGNASGKEQLVFSDSRIHLEVLCGSNLTTVSFLNQNEVKPNSYVRGNIGDVEIISPVCWQTRNPEWNYSTDFILTKGYLTHTKGNLILKVYHCRSTRPQSGDLLLGFVSIGLASLWSGHVSICGWYPLLDLRAKARGRIKLSLTPHEGVCIGLESGNDRITSGLEFSDTSGWDADKTGEDSLSQASLVSIQSSVWPAHNGTRHIFPIKKQDIQVLDSFPVRLNETAAVAPHSCVETPCSMNFVPHCSTEYWQSCHAATGQVVSSNSLPVAGRPTEVVHGDSLPNEAVTSSVKWLLPSRRTHGDFNFKDKQYFPEVSLSASTYSCVCQAQDDAHVYMKYKGKMDAAPYSSINLASDRTILDRVACRQDKVCPISCSDVTENYICTISPAYLTAALSDAPPRLSVSHSALTVSHSSLSANTISSMNSSLSSVVTHSKSVASASAPLCSSDVAFSTYDVHSRSCASHSRLVDALVIPCRAPAKSSDASVLCSDPAIWLQDTVTADSCLTCESFGVSCEGDFVYGSKNECPEAPGSLLNSRAIMDSLIFHHARFSTKPGLSRSAAPSTSFGGPACFREWPSCLRATDSPVALHKRVTFASLDCEAAEDEHNTTFIIDTSQDTHSEDVHLQSLDPAPLQDAPSEGTRHKDLGSFSWLSRAAAVDSPCQSYLDVRTESATRELFSEPGSPLNGARKRKNRIAANLPLYSPT